MHSDVRDFVVSLERIQGLLAADNEHFWRHRIQKVIDLARRSDGYCVELFLSFFGGMGSFGDMDIQSSDEAASSFRKERSRAYTAAQKLLE